MIRAILLLTLCCLSLSAAPINMTPHFSLIHKGKLYLIQTEYQDAFKDGPFPILLSQYVYLIDGKMVYPGRDPEAFDEIVSSEVGSRCLTEKELIALVAPLHHSIYFSANMDILDEPFFAMHSAQEEVIESTRLRSIASLPTAKVSSTGWEIVYYSIKASLQESLLIKVRVSGQFAPFTMKHSSQEVIRTDIKLTQTNR